MLALLDISVLYTSKRKGLLDNCAYVIPFLLYLFSEHPVIDGFNCLFSVSGFSRLRLQIGFPPILLVHNLLLNEQMYVKF